MVRNSQLKIGVVLKPLFLDRAGGLQTQVIETIAALRDIDIQVIKLTAENNNLAEISCIHIFDSEGTDDAMKWAKRLGKPVVLSPVIAPTWTGRKARKAELVSSFARWFTNNRVHTTFELEKNTIKSADRLVALSTAERSVLLSAFDADPTRIRIIPNGVNSVFFDARPELFSERYGLEPGFVLCVGSIYPYKNQLGLAEALKGTKKQIVLIGREFDPGSGYLAQTLKFKNVTHIGTLPSNDPLLAAAYAAAGVLAVPSVSEVFPLVVLEALAAGTPVVLTKNTALDIEAIMQHVTLVDASSPAQIAHAISTALAIPNDRILLSASVRDLEWKKVALSLGEMYEELL
ncbi:MAG: glycosyltransferase [Gammaproteobacteria bacterium]|nr:glycosyltransferase [Gammaproteobacteria bacterium]